MTACESPPLTVLMAYHNDAPYVADAVESILNQTFADFEFVIVNDASTDGSTAIVSRYTDPRIRLLHNSTNHRLARALNRGLDVARGTLVARLDANDVAWPDRLEKQMRFMRRHPEIALVGGQCAVVDRRSRPIRRAALYRPTSEAGVRWFFLFDSPFIHSSVVFRKAAVDAVGRYDPTFEWAPSEDADLWARLARHHRLVNLADVVVSLRYDPTSTTYDITRPFRAAFRPRLTRYFAANMARYLRLECADEWAELMASLFVETDAVDPPTVRAYVRMIQAMERRFVEVNPEATHSEDVRRGTAQLLSRALFRMTIQSRRSSLPVFVRMMRADPATARRLAPKYLAVALLGAGAWRCWNWLNDRTAG